MFVSFTSCVFEFSLLCVLCRHVVFVPFILSVCVHVCDAYFSVCVCVCCLRLLCLYINSFVRASFFILCTYLSAHVSVCVFLSLHLCVHVLCLYLFVCLCVVFVSFVSLFVSNDVR